MRNNIITKKRITKSFIVEAIINKGGKIGIRER